MAGSEIQPFCITEFEAEILDGWSGSIALDTMIAALRFEAHPCRCDGCVQTSRGIDKLGGRR